MKLDPPINKQNVPELVGGLSLTTAGSMRTDDTTRSTMRGGACSLANVE